MRSPTNALNKPVRLIYYGLHEESLRHEDGPQPSGSKFLKESECTLTIGGVTP